MALLGKRSREDCVRKLMGDTRVLNQLKEDGYTDLSIKNELIDRVVDCLDEWHDTNDINPTVELVVYNVTCDILG